MSFSLQQNSNRDIERQHQPLPSTQSTASAQHGYPAVDTLQRRISDEVFLLEAIDDDDSVVREDIGPRTVGRKLRSKRAREGKARASHHDGDYDRDEDDSDLSEPGSSSSPISRLPPEILSRVLAHLDPATLLQCAGVSRTFAGVAKDEATWRLAFALAFRIENIGTPTTPILRRVDAVSWRHEYTRRTELLRRWRKARSPTVISDPRVSTIHAIALSLPHHFLLSASETFGVASRCDPFSGKVAKGFVDASGQLNGLAMGGQHQLAMEQAGEEVSSVCLESDASRIVWGYQNGELGLTTLARQGTNPRGAIKGVRFSSRGIHSGAIVDIAMPFGTARGGAHSIERSPEKLRQRQAVLGEAAEVFVTAGMDGTVRLWSPKKALPIWVEVVQHADVKPPGQVYRRPDPVVCVEMDIGSGTIAAATSEGQVTVWTNIDINRLVALPASAFEDSAAFHLTAALLQSKSDLKRLKQQIVRINMPPLRITGADGGLAPCTLVLDIPSTLEENVANPAKAFSARLLVFCSQGSAFERLDIHKEPVQDATVSSLVYCTPDKGSISVLRPDFDLHSSRRNINTPAEMALYSERRFVCAGTKEGKVVIWDWDQGGALADSAEVPAWCVLDGHHTSITAIDVTAHVIVIGCSDGTIKAFCPLTGQLIRIFNDRTATRHPARMLAAGELTDEEASRFHVSQIIAGPDTLVASIGGQVLAWRAEKIKGKTGRKSAPRAATSGKASVGRLWDPKSQSQKEMERDVFETREQLKQEQEDREAEYERIKFSVGGRSEMELAGALSEQEAFEYAMMLSRDEQEISSTRGSLAGRANEELQGALEQIALAESSEMARERSGSRQPPTDALDDSFDTGTASLSLSPSPSPVSSPNLSGLSSPPSRAWDILQQAGSSALPVSRNQDKWHPNNKVSIVNVPRSARTSSSLSSTAGSSRRPSVHQTRPPGLDSPHDWPTFEPSSFNSRSPGHLHLGSPAATPGVGHPLLSSRAPSWSTSPGMTPSPVLAPTRAVMGAWASGSPSLRPVKDAHPAGELNADVRRPSALSSSKPPAEARDDSLDDDLKYAIELSLAEERSRQAP